MLLLLLIWRVQVPVNYYNAPYTEVNLDRVIDIESSGRWDAYNPMSNARGLGQITPIALKDWNALNPGETYNLAQLFDPQINQKIAYWTLTQRIPQMLQAYRLAVTPENVLWAYNAGIGRVRQGIKPKETREYIKKYFKGEK